jgi:hypothetical protein
MVKKTFTFYSKKEEQAFLNIARSYNSGKHIELLYGYFDTNFHDNYTDNKELNTIQVNFLRHTQIFYYGSGFLVAKSENSSAGELYYTMGIKLSEFSTSGALHLGSVIFIPRLGVKFGIGYHDLYNEKTQTNFHTFVKNTDKDNYGVAKGVIGLDIVLNKSLGITFFTEKNYTMERGVVTGFGFNFKL